MEHTVAIVLAAGQGKRMQSTEKKQYMLLQDKPILYYSLRAMEESFIDAVILVVNSGEQDFVREEIVSKYHFQKVAAIVSGGEERYHSVAAGLEAAAALPPVNTEATAAPAPANIEATAAAALTDIDAGAIPPAWDYCFIHDSARPFVTQEILQRALTEVKNSHACVVGMPVKDTIKIADDAGYVAQTPNRSLVWAVQTPQVFDFSLALSAYRMLLCQEAELKDKGVQITDDAMVVETFTDRKVKLVEGSYTNIKITTPDDLLTATQIQKEQNGN
ncbi:MAG: 2-C-methyl-D-erythritol 4-phosphate cytidylyltransferase [Lachnospiraceae bacterium]|nr:2-C-methyl-D-erythritol 4-phosphate cytidylyltransferase [Lachnospiraceae bacterium]